jgi:hypothetical protein
VPLYPFFLDGVAANPELTQEDGIHPTAAGIRVIVERILPTVSEWLEQDGPASQAPNRGLASNARIPCRGPQRLRKRRARTKPRAPVRCTWPTSG